MSGINTLTKERNPLNEFIALFIKGVVKQPSDKATDNIGNPQKETISQHSIYEEGVQSYLANPNTRRIYEHELIKKVERGTKVDISA